MIPIGKEPQDLEMQMYRRDQEKIVALKLPNNRPKGEFWVADEYALFWV